MINVIDLLVGILAGALIALGLFALLTVALFVALSFGTFLVSLFTTDETARRSVGFVVAIAIVAGGIFGAFTSGSW